MTYRSSNNCGYCELYVLHHPLILSGINLASFHKTPKYASLPIHDVTSTVHTISDDGQPYPCPSIQPDRLCRLKGMIWLLLKA